jgi:hypothetical protein
MGKRIQAPLELCKRQTDKNQATLYDFKARLRAATDSRSNKQQIPGTKMHDQQLPYGKPRGSIGGPAMSDDADGPIRRWFDGLSATTRVAMVVVVVAIVIAVALWG